MTQEGCCWSLCGCRGWYPVALIARSRLTAAGDTLTYRSPLRARAWHRTEICSFDIAPLRWSPSKGQVLVMQTMAGVVGRVPDHHCIRAAALRATAALAVRTGGLAVKRRPAAAELNWPARRVSPITSRAHPTPWLLRAIMQMRSTSERQKSTSDQIR